MTVMVPIDDGMRRLAAARVIEAVRGFIDLPLGMLHLAAWLEGEGCEWLQMAGMGHLADKSADDLARLVFEHAPGALDDTRRCVNCRFLVRVNGNGRARCELGMWQDLGFAQEEYAFSSVKSRFDGCDRFERSQSGVEEV